MGMSCFRGGKKRPICERLSSGVVPLQPGERVDHDVHSLSTGQQVPGKRQRWVAEDLLAGATREGLGSHLLLLLLASSWSGLGPTPHTY